MVVGGARDEHAARWTKLLKASRHVNPVTEEIIAFDYHVAEIDPNPKDQPALGTSLHFMRGDLALNGNRTGDGIDDGVELYQSAIAHEFDNSSLMLAKQGIDHFRSERLDRRERRRLIGFHQARVADHVGGHYCRQPPLSPSCHHDDTLPPTQSCAQHLARFDHFMWRPGPQGDGPSEVCFGAFLYRQWNG